MIKYKYILIFISVFSLSTYAQNANNDKAVQQEWRGTHFSSDKSLMGNIKEVKEIEQILTVFEKGNLEELSVAEENLTIFIPLDSALEKMKRRERKAFLENTPKSELIAMWKEYIVPGRIDEHAIKRNIENREGNSIFVRTLGNNQLEFLLKNQEVYVRDAYGKEAKLVKGNFYHNHGFFHFIDNLLYYETK
ncbi:MAG TPA: fasciclin domain-containing protein [Flavobacteriaceae bacterium]|nr:fasciclin domain-containing protein [Flavobacteriaceae bacterium]